MLINYKTLNIAMLFVISHPELLLSYLIWEMSIRVIS